MERYLRSQESTDPDVITSAIRETYVTEFMDQVVFLRQPYFSRLVTYILAVPTLIRLQPIKQIDLSRRYMDRGSHLQSGSVRKILRGKTQSRRGVIAEPAPIEVSGKGTTLQPCRAPLRPLRK